MNIIRKLNIDFEIDFIRVVGKIKFLCDTVLNIEGKDILLIEDVYDAGKTLSYIKD